MMLRNQIACARALLRRCRLPAPSLRPIGLWRGASRPYALVDQTVVPLGVLRVDRNDLPSAFASPRPAARTPATVPCLTAVYRSHEQVVYTSASPPSLLASACSRRCASRRLSTTRFGAACVPVCNKRWSNSHLFVVCLPACCGALAPLLCLRLSGDLSLRLCRHLVDLRGETP